ncbi:hypothetical protein LXL04_002564 [Taraxacum kok-saghyz]
MAASNITTTERLDSITDIKIKDSIPLILDLEGLNYDAWRVMFETHCIAYGVAHHLQDSNDKAPTMSDKTEWNHIDCMVKMWIYGTISEPVLLMIISKKNMTARELWKSIEALFQRPEGLVSNS